MYEVIGGVARHVVDYKNAFSALYPCIAASTVQEGKNQEGMLGKSYGGERNHTRWSRILMLAAAALAVEVAFTVETGYAIPTVLKSGMPEGCTSIMWAFSPILGIFFQSYIGSASDRCRSKWGRRRPFILVASPNKKQNFAIKTS